MPHDARARLRRSCRLQKNFATCLDILTGRRYGFLMTNNITATALTAQVAAEAIINNEEVFEVDTMNAVLEVARREGVGSLYIGMLEEAIDRQATREGR